MRCPPPPPPFVIHVFGEARKKDPIHLMDDIAHKIVARIEEKSNTTAREDFLGWVAEETQNETLEARRYVEHSRH